MEKNTLVTEDVITTVYQVNITFQEYCGGVEASQGDPYKEPVGIFTTMSNKLLYRSIKHRGLSPYKQLNEISIFSSDLQARCDFLF